MHNEPPAIVLIHGLWMTPRIWERFYHYYEEHGYRVLTPPWPKLRGRVDEVRDDPSLLAGLGIREIVDHYAYLIRTLQQPPIIMGHSFGGLIVQLLLDRGLGAAGVAIASNPPKGVWRFPLSSAMSAGPILRSPLNHWRIVPLSFNQFRNEFANTLSLFEAWEAYTRYVIPAPSRPLFQAASANLNPFASTFVNYRNNGRAPLLLIAGSEDCAVPHAVTRNNYLMYSSSKALTAIKTFPGRSHLGIVQTGWKEVAEYALEWAEDHANVMSERRRMETVSLLEPEASSY